MPQPDARQRILSAAFDAFVHHGFAGASTLEIARAAHVSKRELYSLVGNKQDILVACISARADRLHTPAALPTPTTPSELEAALRIYAAHLLRELTDPTVIAMFRLAIAEAERAPEVARTLDTVGRETTRAGLRSFLGEAAARGLLSGQPAEMTQRFLDLLQGSLLPSLLLGTTPRPRPRQLELRAASATAALLRLYAPPPTPAPS